MTRSQRRPGALVLLRHGQSYSNAEGTFTGWLNPPLTDLGREQSVHAGRRMASACVMPDLVCTSLLSRSVQSADLAVAAMGRDWIPVVRSWRLNERHYGALTGRSKDSVRTEKGEQRYLQWRNSLTIAPPPMSLDAVQRMRREPWHADLPADLIPATESLGDVLRRLLPFWFDAVVPELRSGRTVLVVAHGNSLRALVTHLDQLSQDELIGRRIPVGEPVLYRFTERLIPTHRGGETLSIWPP